MKIKILLAMLLITSVALGQKKDTAAKQEPVYIYRIPDRLILYFDLLINGKGEEMPVWAFKELNTLLNNQTIPQYNIYHPKAALPDSTKREVPVKPKNN